MALMQKKYRRIIFYIFAVLFLVSAPFVLLYATGYRYNLKKNKFEKTGALVLNTLTKNSSFYLDGKQYGGKNEFRIKYLLPGEYETKLTKSGYFDWQKKIIVESQFTTFIKDARLIQNNLPANIINGAPERFYPAQSQLKFLYVKNEKGLPQFGEAGKQSLMLFDAATENEKIIMALSSPIIDISWSPKNDKIILQTQNEFQIINIDNGKIEVLPIKNRILRLRWEDSNESSLYAATADGIYKIDLLFNMASKIYGPIKSADDFIVFQNQLYLASQSAIKQIDLNRNEEVLIPLERPGYKIKFIADKKIFLADLKEHLQIFSLPLNKLSTPDLLANAKDSEMIGNNILYYNDFEIWTYDFLTGEKELITRVGEEIKKARFLNGFGYIVFLLADQIKIIELDKRDGRQIYTLSKFEEISDFILYKGKRLYFGGKMNKADGIYKLEL